jgi:hypothetical protein
MRTTLILLVLLFLPACANMGALQLQLSEASRSLEETKIKLESMRGSPDVAKALGGVKDTLEGFSGVLTAVKAETDKVDGIREKIGAGLSTVGGFAPGPYGILLDLLGKACLVMRRGKEKSYNAGMKKIAGIINGNSEKPAGT